MYIGNHPARFPASHVTGEKTQQKWSWFDLVQMIFGISRFFSSDFVDGEALVFPHPPGFPKITWDPPRSGKGEYLIVLPGGNSF